jgi:hypothetical protein
VGNHLVYSRLVDADLYTLEEVAAKPRAEVAAIKGVGTVTMRHPKGLSDRERDAFATGPARGRVGCAQASSGVDASGPAFSP